MTSITFMHYPEGRKSSTYQREFFQLRYDAIEDHAGEEIANRVEGGLWCCELDGKTYTDVVFSQGD